MNNLEDLGMSGGVTKSIMDFYRAQEIHREVDAGATEPDLFFQRFISYAVLDIPCPVNNAVELERFEFDDGCTWDLLGKASDVRRAEKDLSAAAWAVDQNIRKHATEEDKIILKVVCWRLTWSQPAEP